MAASSGSSSSVDSVKYTDLEPDATFILYMFKEDNSSFEEKQILVETEANITLFLFEWEVKSRKIDPRKYHWHCIHRGSYFHLRSAFSGKMLQTDIYGPEYCQDSKVGFRLVTADDREDEGAFCFLKESPTQSMLYRISEGQLFTVSFGEEFNFMIRYPKWYYEVQTHTKVHWKFERVKSAMVGNVEIKYGPKDYGLPEDRRLIQRNDGILEQFGELHYYGTKQFLLSREGTSNEIGARDA